GDGDVPVPDHLRHRRAGPVRLGLRHIARTPGQRRGEVPHRTGRRRRHLHHRGVLPAGRSPQPTARTCTEGAPGPGDAAVSDRDMTDLSQHCNADGEFRLSARYWTGSLQITIGDETTTLTLDDGVAGGGAAGTGPGHIGVAAPTEVWEQILAPVP